MWLDHPQEKMKVHRKSHRGNVLTRHRAAGYFWAESVPLSEYKGAFLKRPLQLRDPSLMYNRIMSLFARQIRIPTEFAHFGEKVVWHIWQQRRVYPKFTEEPSDAVSRELWGLYKELSMLERESPGALIAKELNSRFKDVGT